MIIIFVSFESMEDAEKVANYLIDNKMAACISLIPIKSFYIWKGEKMTPNEVEGLIKTEDDKFEAVKDAIEKLVGYETLQVIAISALQVSEKYGKWVKDSVK